jgi:hypothetical protein
MRPAGCRLPTTILIRHAMYGIRPNNSPRQVQRSVYLSLQYYLYLLLTLDLNHKSSLFNHEAHLTLSAILSKAMWTWKGLIFHAVFSMFSSLNATKHSAGILTHSSIRWIWYHIFILVRGCVGCIGAIWRRAPSGATGINLSLGEIEKDARIFAVCTGMGTSTMTSSQEILQRQLETWQQVLHHWQAATLCPYHGITAHDPPLYITQTNTGLHGFRGLVVDYITASISGNTSEHHSQINSCMTVQVSMPLGSLHGTTWMYMAMVWASLLDLHIEAVRRIQSTFISVFSIKTPKF